jgi:hypothetical protein
MVRSMRERSAVPGRAMALRCLVRGWLKPHEHRREFACQLPGMVPE